MSRLVILRGVYGTGKSHLCKSIDTGDGSILSSDEIRRTLFGSPKHQHNNELVFDTLFTLMQHRMAERADVVIDATNIRLRESRRYMEEALRWGYRIVVVQFDTLPIDFLMKGIERRSAAGGLYVPREVVERQIERMNNCTPEFQRYVAEVGGEWMTVPEYRYNFVKSPITKMDVPDNVDVYAIGDTHACLKVLQDLVKKCTLESEARGKKAEFILLGDTIDRGPDGFDVLTSPYTKVLGNHEWLFIRELNGYQQCRSHSRRITHDLYKTLEYADQEQVVKSIFDMHTAIYIRRDGVGFLLSHAPMLYNNQLNYASFRDHSMNDIDHTDWNMTNFKVRYYNIHGHQSWQYDDVNKSIAEQADNWFKLINIDSGAVYGGYLTALRLDKELHVVQVLSDVNVEK